MFELAATPQRRFKGLTLLVDRDGMEIDVRHLIVLGVALLAMHVGDNNDLDQAAMELLWQAQHNFLMPSCTGS